MAQDATTEAKLLQEARDAERALIDAEARAEVDLAVAEGRYRQALEKLARAQARAAARRKEFEQARARLDQCQLERAAGPVIRRLSVPRPVLPRPARDDSRARRTRPERNEPAPKDAGSSDPETE